MAHISKIVDVDDITKNPEQIENQILLSKDAALGEFQISSQPNESNKTKNQIFISKYFPTKVKIRTAPCTNINNMNGDCLSELFRGQFTLQEMMHLRRVCVQWQTIIEQLFSRNRFLKIFIQKDSFIEHFRTINQMIEQARMEKDDEEGLFTFQSDANGVDDVLVIKNLDVDSNPVSLAFVSKLFSSIQNLFIVFPKNCRLHNIPTSQQYHNKHDHFRLTDMLAQWPKLRSLSLKDASASDNFDNHWFDSKSHRHLLWQAQPQLSSLHLFGRCSIHRLQVKVLFEQLKRLAIVEIGKQRIEGFVEGDGRIVNDEKMPYLGKCTRLISIFSSIGTSTLYYECLATGKDSKDNTQLTHLTFVAGTEFFTDFSKFKALTCLDVNLVQPFQEFVSILKKSTTLNELRIKMSGLVDMSNQKENQLAIDPNQHIPVLSSVITLHLRIFQSYLLLKESPKDQRLEPTFLKALPQIFPNLKTAKLITISKIVKSELEMCFKSRGAEHFPLLRSVESLSSTGLIDLDNYSGPYRDLLTDKSYVKDIILDTS